MKAMLVFVWLVAIEIGNYATLGKVQFMRSIINAVKNMDRADRVFI